MAFLYGSDSEDYKNPEKRAELPPSSIPSMITGVMLEPSKKEVYLDLKLESKV